MKLQHPMPSLLRCKDFVAVLAAAKKPTLYRPVSPLSLESLNVSPPIPIPVNVQTRRQDAEERREEMHAESREVRFRQRMLDDCHRRFPYENAQRKACLNCLYRRFEWNRFSVEQCLYCEYDKEEQREEEEEDEEMIFALDLDCKH